MPEDGLARVSKQPKTIESMFAAQSAKTLGTKDVLLRSPALGSRETPIDLDTETTSATSSQQHADVPVPGAAPVEAPGARRSGSARTNRLSLIVAAEKNLIANRFVKGCDDDEVITYNGEWASVDPSSKCYYVDDLSKARDITRSTKRYVVISWFDVFSEIVVRTGQSVTRKGESSSEIDRLKAEQAKDNAEPIKTTPFKKVKFDRTFSWRSGGSGQSLCLWVRRKSCIHGPPM